MTIVNFIMIYNEGIKLTPIVVSSNVLQVSSIKFQPGVKKGKHFCIHSPVLSGNFISMVSNIFFCIMLYTKALELLAELQGCKGNMSELFIAPPIHLQCGK